MGPASRSGAADTPAAPVVRAGVVSRPGLFELLGAAGRVTEVSAPPGSGKTLLLRSWIGESGLAERAAWVPVQGEERDPQRFWLSVLGALRDTAAGSKLVRPLTAAPDLDGWAVVERLLTDLGGLEDRVWLVIDDVHELRSAEALRQLELLVMRAPAGLRFVLATRHDLRLGLHRLRLEGELTEIRAADLRFTVEEARALFEAAGVPLSDPALGSAVRADRGLGGGVAAGGAVAGRAPGSGPVRGRVLRQRAHGRGVPAGRGAGAAERAGPAAAAADLGAGTGERRAGRPADRGLGRGAGLAAARAGQARSWSRWMRGGPGSATTSCSPTCCSWSCGAARRPNCPRCTRPPPGGTRTTGTRSRRSATPRRREDWGLAARLLSDHWVGLGLNGLGATAHELLARFPAGVIAADAELAARMAGDELARGSLEEAERYLALATRGLESVPADRRGRSQVVLAVVRMRLARQRGDLPAVAEQAQRLLAPAGAADPARLGLGEDLRALALINLGIAELWTARFEEADRHLEDGIALARRIGRPYLEVTGLAHWAQLAELAVVPAGGAAEHAGDRAGRAARLDRGAGRWRRLPGAGRGDGRPGAARGGGAVARPCRAHRPGRGRAGGRDEAALRPRDARARAAAVTEALAAFRTAERLATLLVTEHTLARRLRSHLLQTLVRMGETQRVEQALAEMDGAERDSGEMRIAAAALRLAQDDPEAATVALAPVLDGSVPLTNAHLWVVQAFLLEAIARDALGDAGAARRALERALDLAEPEGLLFPFLLIPRRSCSSATAGAAPPTPP